jgi:quinol monooxygenase YgiN
MSSASPVMTVLEARVSPDRAAELRRVYDSVGPLPSQMLQTVLAQSTADPAIWRVISLWRSRAALEEYRRSVSTPTGIMMFRSVGAEPAVSVWDVATAHLRD